MGLGPSVCTKCKVLHVYIPNEENPSKQGRWVCPFNEFHEESSLWMLPMVEQKLYLANTKFINFVTNDHTDKKHIDQLCILLYNAE